SKSRSGVFVLVFGFILLSGLAGLYFRRGEKEKKGIKTFLKVVFLVIVVISLYIGIGATLERFSLDQILQEQRPRVWGNTVEIIGDFPVFGSGLGTFDSVYTAYEESGKFVRWSHAHNDYLQYAAEVGVVGLALLLGGILFMLVNSFRIWRERRHPQVKGLALGGIVGLVGILIHSITDFNLHIPANMVLFAVILSLTMVTAFYRSKKT
ncbi:MAG TPA: O-antigen ligase family protein, partial [Acidobacteriota bacterium]|nr:O-antigen ligase family protein [Acidobacteriota bacterium]